MGIHDPTPATADSRTSSHPHTRSPRGTASTAARLCPRHTCPAGTADTPPSPKPATRCWHPRGCTSQGDTPAAGQSQGRSTCRADTAAARRTPMDSRRRRGTAWARRRWAHRSSLQGKLSRWRCAQGSSCHGDTAAAPQCPPRNSCQRGTWRSPTQSRRRARSDTCQRGSGEALVPDQATRARTDT
jgi:hypothetical protein